VTAQRQYIALDLYPSTGSISLFVKDEAGEYVLVYLGKRQARALANRINQNVDYAEGKAARRPGTPHFWFDVPEDARSNVERSS
jgi:hypothetical protein